MDYATLFSDNFKLETLNWRPLLLPIEISPVLVNELFRQLGPINMAHESVSWPVPRGKPSNLSSVVEVAGGSVCHVWTKSDQT